MATALCQTKIWFGLPTSRNTRIKLFIDYVIPLVKLIAAKYRDEAVNFFFHSIWKMVSIAKIYLLTYNLFI